ncbi:MAG: hypothetical protein MMC23_003136 [Stictis urceolatum]|nr:hypothetical protein [Stictis urceolata]
MPTEILAVENRRKYHWPEAQLNFWIIIMLAAAAIEVGVFANFMTIQNQMGLGIPWALPYQVTVGSITLAFLVLMLWLINVRSLLPGIVLLGSFMLFVLWLTGLVEVSIQLFGGGRSINSNCSNYVNGMPYTGVSVGTLAFLEQRMICQTWQTGFAFQIVGLVFLIWMMVMAYQVNNDEYD